MSLSQNVTAELERLNCPTTTSQAVSTSDGPHRFECELAALDSLGCAFSRFELHSDRLATATIDQLKKVAEQLSSRLTYLLEAIKPVEVDADQCVVQLRSMPPHKSDTGTSYYELHVCRGGLLNLCRYQAQPGQPREQVPAHVTREVFLRLVQDFAEAA